MPTTTSIRVAAVLLLLPIGAIAQSPPVRAETLSVGGRQVEVIQAGSGAPTIVLEAGGGNGATSWGRVLTDLATTSRVIAYSRPGRGGSSVKAGLQTPQSMVADLHELLAALGEREPVILVGHSWGGLLARLYVSTYPSAVAGIVLIDAAHEAQFARWDALVAGHRMADTMEALVSQLPLPVRLDFAQILPVQRAQHVAGMRPLPGDLPVAVITATKPCPPAREFTCRDPRALAIWRALHDEWFANAATGLRIVSAQSGHYVMFDRPELIVQAVRFVVDQVRLAK